MVLEFSSLILRQGFLVTQRPSGLDQCTNLDSGLRQRRRRFHSGGTSNRSHRQFDYNRKSDEEEQDSV